MRRNKREYETLENFIPCIGPISALSFGQKNVTYSWSRAISDEPTAGQDQKNPYWDYGIEELSKKGILIVKWLPTVLMLDYWPSSWWIGSIVDTVPASLLSDPELKATKENSNPKAKLDVIHSI